MRYLPVLGVIALVVAALGAATSSTAAAGSATVTNSNDAGAGSFRAAVELANGNAAIGNIVFVGNLDPIELQSTVLYNGSQSLMIVGNNAVLDANALVGTADAFRIEKGADLSVSGLTILNAPGEGLEYQVAAGATGTKHVSLNGVRVVGPPNPALAKRGGHGVLLNDQADPEGPGIGGSAASLDVSVLNSEFDGNGFGALDRDGLRVNEGGGGSLSFVVRNTIATDNGADGIELDERDVGDAVFTVAGTQITGNGSFHDLYPPTPPTPENPIDLDDGMDVDESQAGALIGTVSNSAASNNREEGWDFNENHAGNFEVDMTNVEANGNLEEGVDFEEDDDFAGGGDLVTRVIGVTADENGGDAGLKIREKGDGNLDASVRRAHANGNLNDGINFREDAAGNLTASVSHSTADDNSEDGIHFDENAAGNLTSSAGHGSASGNAEVGVLGDQAGAADVGTLDVVFMSLVGNGVDDVAVAGNVTLTQTP